MKAIVLKATRKIVVRDVPDAEMRATTDVLLRLTSTAICGTDLHFYEGRMRGLEGQVIGHEPLGVVEEAGSAVSNVKKGDRVTVPTHICCGFCVMCAEGHTSACLTTNPGQAGAAYGYPHKGDTRVHRPSSSAYRSLMPTASSFPVSLVTRGKTTSCCSLTLFPRVTTPRASSTSLQPTP